MAAAAEARTGPPRRGAGRRRGKRAEALRRCPREGEAMPAGAAPAPGGPEGASGVAASRAAGSPGAGGGSSLRSQAAPGVVPQGEKPGSLRRRRRRAVPRPAACGGVNVGREPSAHAFFLFCFCFFCLILSVLRDFRSICRPGSPRDLSASVKAKPAPKEEAAQNWGTRCETVRRRNTPLGQPLPCSGTVGTQRTFF